MIYCLCSGRTTLGTASWLTFINLHKNINDKVSRVQYVKFIDIWFITSTIFIFASLVEFAVVNSIERGRYPVGFTCRVNMERILYKIFCCKRNRNNAQKPLT